jgi:hypothetical protein
MAKHNRNGEGVGQAESVNSISPFMASGKVKKESYSRFLIWTFLLFLFSVRLGRFVALRSMHSSSEFSDSTPVRLQI